MKLRLIHLPLAVLAIALSITGCKKDDPCDSVTCYNGGTCSDGTCSCGTGYQGTDCGTEWRSKFLGSYVGNMACSTGNFTINLSVNNSANGVTSITMNDGTDTWVAVLSSTNNFSIATQAISGGTSVSGSGQLAGNILTLNLILSNSGNTVNCTYSGTKQ
ncbi:MAG: calcium-binding EGF-like domain-containing protein [Flavobacteriales bacterium]